MKKLATALLVCVLSGVGLAEAHAQLGDKTHAHDSYNTELSTNQCSGAFLTTQVDGPAPELPGEIQSFFGGSSGCAVRVRVRFVQDYNSGTPRYSDWRRTSGHDTDLFYVKDAFRCWSEIGVRRKDGSYYTRFQVNPAVPAHCARRDTVALSTPKETILRSTACDSAEFETLGTDSTSTRDTFSVRSHSLYDGCATRVRLVYVKNLGGTRYISSWVYHTGQSIKQAPTISGIYRCRTDVQVKRKDGTWFGWSQNPTYRPAGCGS